MVITEREIHIIRINRTALSNQIVMYRSAPISQPNKLKMAIEKIKSALPPRFSDTPLSFLTEDLNA